MMTQLLWIESYFKAWFEPPILLLVTYTLTLWHSLSIVNLEDILQEAANG